MSKHTQHPGEYISPPYLSCEESYQIYAEKIGKPADELTDIEKQAAVLDAVRKALREGVPGQE